MSTLALLPLLLVACDRGDFEASAALADGQSTVAWARWSTADPGVSWVEHGPTRDLGYTTRVATDEATEHEVLVAGLRPSTTVYWRAFTQVGDTVLQSGLGEIETGAPPRELPDLSSSDDADPDLSTPGFTLFNSLGSDGIPSWIVVLDGEGEPVWWYEASDEETVVAQARLGDDGTSVLYNLAAREREYDVGEIVRVRLDGVELSRTTTPLGHHDFVEMPQGGYAYIAADIRDTEIDGETWSVVGDAIVEIDEGAAEGTAVYSIWDADLPPTDPADDDGFYPQGLDWTHANNLVYDEAADTWLLSIRNLSLLQKVDRASAQVQWTLGEGGDFELLDGRAFYGQHSPEWTDEGILLFDNGGLAGEETALAVEFAIDEDARTYEEIWSWDDNGRHRTFLMGDADRLANGSTLVSWGNVGRIHEVTASGEKAFEVDLGLGNPLGFSHHLDALGGVP